MPIFIKRTLTILIPTGLSVAALGFHYNASINDGGPEWVQYKTALQERQYERTIIDTRIEEGMVLPNDMDGAVHYDADTQTNIIVSPDSGIHFD